MAQERLRRLFQARATAQGDQIFGTPQLVAPDHLPQLAPIERIAIFTEAFLPKIDGVTKTTYFTVRYLQQTGRDVLVFAPDCSVPAVGSSQVIRLPAISVPGAAETRMAFPHPLIAQRLHTFQPDLIHLCSPALMSATGVLVGRQLGVPVLANYQTDLPGYTRQYGYHLLRQPLQSWLRHVHNQCHVNLVPANSTMHQLHQEGFRRLRLWQRGVNLERFNPAHRSGDMRKRLLAGRPDASLLVIYVGRLAKEKSLDLLSGIAEEPGVALTLIGDGQMREDLQQQFARTDTHFTGYLYGDALAAAYASADVFVFPGSQETFGQAVLEALAAGLPAVVTERGGVHERVHDEVTGYVVAHNSDAFVEAVRKLRDDPQLRRRMAQQAHEHAATQPWSTIFAQLEQHYQHALTLNQRSKRLAQHGHQMARLRIGRQPATHGMMRSS